MSDIILFGSGHLGLVLDWNFKFEWYEPKQV